MPPDVTHERGINAFLLKSWLKERFGEDGLRSVMSKIGSESGAMLENPLLNEWYPVSLVKEIFEAIHRLYNDEHPGILVEYGRFAAERSLKGFLRYLARLLSIEQLTRRMGAFWKQYHRGGSISAGKVEEEGGEVSSGGGSGEVTAGTPLILLDGGSGGTTPSSFRKGEEGEEGRRWITVTVRGFNLGIPGCQVIGGYLEGLIPMANVKDVKVKKKTCIHHGDPVCSWEVSWEK